MNLFADISRQNFQPQRSPGKRLLIIESDTHHATCLNDYLLSKGYHVSIASDEDEGLCILQTRIVYGIFLSIDAPVMHGLEMVKHIRTHYPKIPVIVMATELGRTQLQEAFLEGVKGCVSKPVLYD